MISDSSVNPRPFSVLRRFVRPKPAGRRCELCNAAIGDEHDHLIEPATRKLACACTACAILFSDRHAARYRRVPRGVRVLADFRMSDEQWEALRVPINLVFFFHSTPERRMVALYPSPAGATESLL